jgi:hypothetical protein
MSENMYEVTVKIKGRANSIESAMENCRLRLEVTAMIKSEFIEIVGAVKVPS